MSIVQLHANRRQAVPPLSSRPYGASDVIAVGGAVLVVIGSFTLGDMHAWGLDSLDRVPLALRCCLAVVMVAAVWLQRHVDLQRTVRHMPAWVLEWLNRMPRWMAVMGAGGLFWLLRDASLAGDGSLKLALVDTGSIDSDPYVWKEPLDSFVTYVSANVVHRFGGDARLAIALVSIAAGMLFTVMVLRLADTLVAHVGATCPQIRVIAIAVMFAGGSTQLWCGHIENYSLVTACVIAGLVSAIRFQLDDAPLWPVGVWCGFAVAVHPQAAFVAVAVVVLIRRASWKRDLVTVGVGSMIGPVVAVVLLRSAGVAWPRFGHGYAGDTNLFVPLSQILQRQHLWDVANNWFLVAPLMLWWFVVLIGSVRHCCRGGQSTQQVHLFLAVAAAGVVVYSLVFENDLPRVQDWDLYAIVGPVVSMCGLTSWALGRRQDCMLGAVLFAAVVSASFVLTNAF